MKNKEHIIEIINDIQCRLNELKSIVGEKEDIVNKCSVKKEESYFDILNKEINQIMSVENNRKDKNGKWTEETFRLLYLSIHTVKTRNFKTAKAVESFCKPIAEFLGLELLKPEYNSERIDNKDTYYGLLLDRRARHFTDKRTEFGEIKEWKNRLYSDYNFLKEYNIKSSESLFDIQYNKQCRKEGCYKFI